MGIGKGTGKGGARPGAGAKKHDSLEYQASQRAVVERIVTQEKWAEAVEAMLKEVKAGNVKAWFTIAPYVLGAPPKEVTLKGDDTAPLRIVIE